MDKFLYNAKRASLVQSRINAIEREVVVDAVEDEASFSFAFPDRFVYAPILIFLFGRYGIGMFHQAFHMHFLCSF